MIKIKIFINLHMKLKCPMAKFSAPQNLLKFTFYQLTLIMEKNSKKILTTSNSSKNTGTLLLLLFAQCIKLILIDIVSFILYLLYLLPWRLPFPKTIFQKIMSFLFGLYSIATINHAFPIGATFKHWT